MDCQLVKRQTELTNVQTHKQATSDQTKQAVSSQCSRMPHLLSPNVQPCVSTASGTVLAVCSCRVPTLLVTKNSRTFPGPQKHFPGLHHKPAMFKYRDKQQLLTIYIYSMIAAHARTHARTQTQPFNSLCPVPEEIFTHSQPS